MPLISPEPFDFKYKVNMFAGKFLLNISGGHFAIGIFCFSSGWTDSGVSMKCKRTFSYFPLNLMTMVSPKHKLDSAPAR